MNARLHCSFKQADVSSPLASGTIAVPSGGVAKDWTIAAGEYADFSELATAIQTAINAQYAGFLVYWANDLLRGTDDVFQINNSAATFDLTVNDPLQSFTGIPDGTSANLGGINYIDGSTPGAFFNPTAALSNNDMVRVYVRDQSYHGTTVYTIDRQIAEYTYEARVEWRGDTERAQWRSFLEYARAGTPFRLYVNEDDATAWSDNNLDGYLDCILPQDQATTAERMARETSTFIGYFDARFVVLA